MATPSSEQAPGETTGPAAITASEPVLSATEFLHTPTPVRWLDGAAANLDTLLVDHANCEKKAAGSALSLMYKYVDHPRLLQTLSRLAREELRHFEQVVRLMGTLGVSYAHLPPSPYAATLHKRIATHEPLRLLDSLLVGAVVEARSAERFVALEGRLPAAVAELYARFALSEARHYAVYLQLAYEVDLTHQDVSIPDRLDALLAAEAELITQPSGVLRFHSGPLQGSV